MPVPAQHTIACGWKRATAASTTGANTPTKPSPVRPSLSGRLESGTDTRAGPGYDPDARALAGLGRSPRQQRTWSQ